MFATQLKFETLRLVRSPALWLALAFLFASVGYGLYNGVQRLRAQEASAALTLETQAATLATNRAKADSIGRGLVEAGPWYLDPTNVVNTGGVWNTGKYVTLAPGPQRVLAAGMSDLQPDTWGLLLFSTQSHGDFELENPVNLASGAFDLAFVLAFLLPLLVIALSYNLVSGEREAGTLALQLSQPVAAGQLFFGKTVARFVLLSGLTVLVTLPTLLIAGLGLGSAATWVTLAVALAYALFWFLLVLGINLREGSSARDALLCIGAWVGFTLVVPAVISTLSQKLHPVPSRAGYLTAQRQLKKELDDSHAKRLDAAYAQNPSYPRLPDAEKSTRDRYQERFWLYAGEQARYDSLAAIYTAAADRQHGFAQSLTLASPTLSVYRQMNELAGANRERARAAEAAVGEAQAQWMAWFREKFDANAALTPADYDEIAKFDDRVTAEAGMRPAGLLLLLLQCLLVGGWVWWRARLAGSASGRITSVR